MIKGIRRELDARRQSKADVESAGAHKETMLGLLRASQTYPTDKGEIKQRRLVVAGDPEAVATSKDGSQRRTNNPSPRDSGGHVEVK
jgi:hypothetical protein